MMLLNYSLILLHSCCICLMHSVETSAHQRNFSHIILNITLLGREAHDSSMKFLELRTYRGQHWHTALSYTTETVLLFESFESAFCCSVLGTCAMTIKLDSILVYSFSHGLFHPEDLFSQVWNSFCSLYLQMILEIFTSAKVTRHLWFVFDSEQNNQTRTDFNEIFRKGWKGPKEQMIPEGLLTFELPKMKAKGLWIWSNVLY